MTDALHAGDQAGYGRKVILDGVDLQVPHGAITALVGPTDRASRRCSRCAGAAGPNAGVMLIDGVDIATLKTREVAQRLAILPQGPSAPPHLTVRDLVEQGRYPWVGPFRMLARQDAQAIDAALKLVGLEEFADRDVDTLSGGERQRAWLALALAQDTSILALDEPLLPGHRPSVRGARARPAPQTRALDDRAHGAARSQPRRRLRRPPGGAESWPRRVRRRAVVILQPDLLRDVFGVSASVIKDPSTGKPLIVPRASAART